MKRKLLATLAVFAVLFPANGLFHSVVAAGFLDRRLAALGKAVLPMHEARPGAVAVLDFLLAALVVLAIAGDERRSRRRALAAGLGINLASSAAWNLGNTASFVAWPIDVTLIDVAWHTSLGALAGLAALRVLGQYCTTGPAIVLPPARTQIRT